MKPTRRFLAAAGVLTGALLLVAWGEAGHRMTGEAAALTPRKRGRKPTRDARTEEVARLERRVAMLETELKKAETIIDVQKKLSLLLGVSLPAPTEEDFARADTRRRR